MSAELEREGMVKEAIEQRIEKERKGECGNCPEGLGRAHGEGRRR